MAHLESAQHHPRIRPRGFLWALVAVALLASACSSGSSAKVAVVHSSKVGADILEMAGRPMYVHLLSTGAPATCDIACLSEWPAVDASSVPPAERGVHASMLSTTLLAGGTRVLTYDGQRLYYFYKDTSSHVNGEGIESFGGYWYVISPAGKPIIRRAVSPPSAKPSNSSY
jgi:predicted lipoprotein with Yx(FWY)xxD motif